MFDCSTTQSNIDEFLDEELSLSDKKLFKQHLANCQSCMQEFKAIEETIAALKSLDLVEPPADFHEKLMGQLVKVKYEQKRSLAAKLTSKSWFSLTAVAAALVLVVTSVFVYNEGGISKIASKSMSSPVEQATPRLAFAPEEMNTKMGFQKQDGEIAGQKENESQGEAAEIMEESGAASSKDNNHQAYSSPMSSAAIDDEDGAVKHDEIMVNRVAKMSAPIVESETDFQEENMVSAQHSSENEVNQIAFKLEIETDFLSDFLGRIEAIIEEQDLEMELAQEGNQTKIIVNLPAAQENVLEIELNSLIKEEEELVKEIKKAEEEDTNLNTSVLIIEFH